MMIKGSESGGQKQHVDPVDPDSDPDPEHCIIYIIFSLACVPVPVR